MEARQKVLTIPNIITSLRILLSPLALWLLWSENWKAVLPIALLMLISDFADGFLARKLGQVSNLGIILDPTADKIILISTYFVFLVKGLVPTWACAVFLAKDLTVPVVVFFLRKRKKDLTPTLAGKSAVVGQLVVAVLVVAEKSLGVYLWWRELLYPVALLCVLSFVSYLKMLIRVNRPPQKRS